jgi:hypothetical protein
VEGMEVYEVEEAFAGNEYDLYEQLLIVSRYLTLDQILALRLKHKQFQYWLHYSLKQAKELEGITFQIGEPSVLPPPSAKLAVTMRANEQPENAFLPDQSKFLPLIRVCKTRCPKINRLFIGAGLGPPTLIMSPNLIIHINVNQYNYSQLRQDTKNTNIILPAELMDPRIYFKRIMIGSHTRLQTTPRWIQVQHLVANFKNYNAFPNLKILQCSFAPKEPINSLSLVKLTIGDRADNNPNTVTIPYINELVLPSLQILEVHIQEGLVNLSIFPNLVLFMNGDIRYQLKGDIIDEDEIINN